MPLSFVVGATGCSVAATRINRIRRSQRSSHSRPRDAAPFLTHARARARARVASDRDERNDRAESKLRLSRFLPNFSVGSRSSRGFEHMDARSAGLARYTRELLAQAETEPSWPSLSLRVSSPTPSHQRNRRRRRNNVLPKPSICVFPRDSETIVV